MGVLGVLVIPLAGSPCTGCGSKPPLLEGIQHIMHNMFAPTALEPGDEKFLIRAGIPSPGNARTAPGKVCACMSGAPHQIRIRAGILLQGYPCMANGGPS